MTRQEFIEGLRIALQGKISQNRINEHLKYYDNYIMEEARKGRTEQQVIEQLGDPRLIAKTLINTSEEGREPYTEDSYKNEDAQKELHSRGIKLNNWLRKILLVVMAICIIVVIARVVAFLLPIVVPVILFLLILSFVFGDRR